MKTIVLKVFTGLLISLMIISIPVIAQNEDDDSDEPGPQSALSKGPKFGTDSTECVKNFSLYREYFKMYVRDKNEAYLKDAIDPWRYLFLNCPLATQNTFIDGITIVKFLYEKETDAVRKEKYIDTLMMVYDNRIVYFGKEGYVLGRKGADMMKFRPKEITQIYNTFSRSYDLKKDKSEGAVLYYYFIATANYVKAGKGDSSLVIDVYDKVSTSAEKNVKNGLTKGYQSALDNIESAFTPWASCNDLIRIYETKFKQTPDDLDLLKKITGILERKACNDNDLYFNAALRLHQLEPSAESAMTMGRMSIARKRFNDAAGFFDQAVGLFQDNDKKADAFLLQADAYRQMNSFTSARNSALKAAALRPNDGTPFLIIGDLYVNSANQCGEDEFTKRTVYWAAVDKYQRARSLDPGNTRITELASQRISQYTRQFPIKSDIFFQGLTVGNTYNIGCWIGESTTIRSSD